MVIANIYNNFFIDKKNILSTAVSKFLEITEET